VARSATPPRVNPVLQEGYQAFMAGDLATAAQAYAGALRQDPNNRDALLGNAAVAARRNDTATATAGYMRLLELNPSDPDAQAGLLALRPGDSSQSELRLKELLRREPGSGPLEFALGNLYAQQGRWPDAQQAYFRAYTATPDNADYAFNLAVGLDQLNQRKLALTYYQRALDLSRSGPAVFDRNAARRRADQITASLPPPQQPPQAQPQARTQAVPAPGAALAPPPAAPPPAATAAFTPPAPSVPQAAMAADSPVAGADSAARPTGDGAPPGRAGNNGRQP
jgi:tetratricopeptide (TPR) repeat protein